MADEANATTETAPKKKGVCAKMYLGEGDTKTRSADVNALGLEFAFNNGKTHVVKLDAFPDNIKTCLQWFGVSEKLGNAYAGAKGDSDVAEENFLSMLEQLTGGTWVEKSDGVGPRPSLIADAIIAALTDKGEKVDDKRKESIREKVKDKATREGALKDPAIKAHFEQAKADRAMERAQAAAKLAKDSTMEVEGF